MDDILTDEVSARPAATGIRRETAQAEDPGPSPSARDADWRELHRRWSGLVHAQAWRALGDSREAEDVTQQVFADAWRGRHGYAAERGAPAAWLVGITRHRVADAQAARARRARVVASVSAQPAPVAHREGADVPETVLDRVVLADALSRLSSAQRRVLRLAYYDDLTQIQISRITGWPLGTVKSHARRGLDSLRRSLAAERPGAAA